MNAGSADNHLDEVRSIFEIDDITKVIISVAFLNYRGFVLLKDLLSPIADKTIVFTGMQNGITSFQGVAASVESGCKTYVVDTGSKSILFHPKVYLCMNSDEAKLVLGSANLTSGGLTANIEASLKLVADLSSSDDARFIADLVTKLESMITKFPENVFEINSVGTAHELFAAGRLVDENTVVPNPSGSYIHSKFDPIPKMEINRNKTPQREVPPTIHSVVKNAKVRVSMSSPKGALMWRSKKLTRRALNIPKANGTNPTGSMNFTKGQIADIDQRHYFREEVFAELNWQNDTTPGKEHLERAEGDFRIIIKDVDCGIYRLSLTHDSRRDSKTYKQKNSVTELHWGTVKPLIAKDDLLERTMYLYKDNCQSNLFILEVN